MDVAAAPGSAAGGFKFSKPPVGKSKPGAGGGFRFAKPPAGTTPAGGSAAGRPPAKPSNSTDAKPKLKRPASDLGGGSGDAVDHAAKRPAPPRPQEAAAAAAAGSGSGSGSGPDFEAQVQQLTGMGFAEPERRAMLELAGGELEAAAQLLLG